MNIPGFLAEAAITRSADEYRTSTYSAAIAPGLIPQAAIRDCVKECQSSCHYQCDSSSHPWCYSYCMRNCVVWNC